MKVFHVIDGWKSLRYRDMQTIPLLLYHNYKRVGVVGNVMQFRAIGVPKLIFLFFFVVLGMNNTKLSDRSFLRHLPPNYDGKIRRQKVCQVIIRRKMTLKSAITQFCVIHT